MRAEVNVMLKVTLVMKLNFCDNDKYIRADNKSVVNEYKCNEECKANNIHTATYESEDVKKK